MTSANIPGGSQRNMPHPFASAQKPKKAPRRPKVEPSVCYMCDEVIP